MKSNTGRFAWVTKLSRIVLIASLIFIVLSMALAVTSLVYVGEYNASTIISTAAAVLGGLIISGMLIVAFGLVQVWVSAEIHLEELPSQLDRTESLLSDSASNLKDLRELATLSDKAKSLIYREREIEAFHETIHHDMMRQDYQTAEMMIEQIEKDFGYVEEAERMKKELADSRKATMDEKIDAAIGRIQKIVETEDWTRALREAQRMMTVFPDNEKVQSLPQRIDAARQQHKRRLLQEYGEAVRKNDIDTGVELLKKLDGYLTPQEAAALRESARGIFRAKLHQLGVQFAICVNDQNWKEAVISGEQIITEYPNSRMAHEVRQKLDALRSKAANQQARKVAAT